MPFPPYQDPSSEVRKRNPRRRMIGLDASFGMLAALVKSRVLSVSRQWYLRLWRHRATKRRSQANPVRKAQRLDPHAPNLFCELLGAHRTELGLLVGVGGS